MRGILYFILTIGSLGRGFGQDVVINKEKIASESGLQFNNIDINGCLCAIKLEYKIRYDENSEDLVIYDIKIFSSINKPNYCLYLADPVISIKAVGVVNGKIISGWINSIHVLIYPEFPGELRFNQRRDFDRNWLGWEIIFSHHAAAEISASQPLDKFLDETLAKQLWNSNFKVVDIKFWPREDYKDLLSRFGNDRFSETQKEAKDLAAKGDYDGAITAWKYYKFKYPEDTKFVDNEIYKLEVERQNKKREATKKQEMELASAQVGSMTALGVFMFQDMGRDGPKGIYYRGGTRFNLHTGYSFSYMPIYDNAQSEYGDYTTSSNVYTLNFDFGVQFWPYYSDNFGLGIIGNGKGGYMPIGGQSFSYQYDYGIEAFLGFRLISLTASYQMGDRGFDRTQTFAGTTSDTYYDSEGAAKFVRLSIGPRFTFNSTHPIGHLELLYTKETYPNMKKISSSGFQIIYSNHNRIRVYGEVILNAARTGIINYELQDDVENKGLLVQLGVVRMFDWFKQ